MRDPVLKVKEETDTRRYHTALTCTLTQACPLTHMGTHEHVLRHANHNKETIKEEAWGCRSGAVQVSLLVEFHLL